MVADIYQAPLSPGLVTRRLVALCTLYDSEERDLCGSRRMASSILAFCLSESSWAKHSFARESKNPPRPLIAIFWGEMRRPLPAWTLVFTKPFGDAGTIGEMTRDLRAFVYMNKLRLFDAAVLLAS